MTPKTGLSPLRYGCAVASVAVAPGVSLLLDPVLNDLLPFALFLLAILLSAWVGGFGPLVLAVLLGKAASTYLFLAPNAGLANVRGRNNPVAAK